MTLASITQCKEVYSKGDTIERDGLNYIMYVQVDDKPIERVNGNIRPYDYTSRRGLLGRNYPSVTVTKVDTAPIKVEAHVKARTLKREDVDVTIVADIGIQMPRCRRGNELVDILPTMTGPIDADEERLLMKWSGLVNQRGLFVNHDGPFYNGRKVRYESISERFQADLSQAIRDSIANVVTCHGNFESISREVFSALDTTLFNEFGLDFRTNPKINFEMRSEDNKAMRTSIELDIERSRIQANGQRSFEIIRLEQADQAVKDIEKYLKPR